MKNILISGAAGFIGSHLTELLVKKGYNVKVFVRYKSTNLWGWLESSDVQNDIEVIKGDIRDYDSVKDAIKGCDAVFHLAALIGIPYSYVSPLAYIRTNVEGTYNILQASREMSLENVIVTSTSETYGTAQYVPIDEKHPLIGQSPYSASKIGADQLALSYHKSFNLPVKIVRPFNTYGPRQSARAVIPTIITQLLSEQPLKLGNLSPKRDLTFVLDTAEGFLEIAKVDELNGTVTNIGMNEEISVGKLAEKIAMILNKHVRIEEDPLRIRPANSEVERLRCDNTLITSKTNWKPSYDLNHGLIETINWIKKNLGKYKASVYNV